MNQIFINLEVNYKKEQQEKIIESSKKLQRRSKKMILIIYSQKLNLNRFKIFILKYKLKIRLPMKSVSYQPHNTVSHTCSLAILLFGTFSAIGLFVVNLIIEKPLFQIGLNYLYKYQQLAPQSSLKLLNNCFSLFLDSYAIEIYILIYLLLSKRKLLILTHIAYYFICEYITSILKQIMQQPRPYWYNDKIQKLQWDCPKKFGIPSQHTLQFIIFFQPIVSDAIGCIGSRFCKPFGWLITILCILVMNSKFYLGVHSLNQILFSLAFGLTLLVLYKYGYQKAIMQFYWLLLAEKKKIFKIISIVIFTLFFLALPIAFFEINKRSRPVNQDYVDRLNNVCKKNLTSENLQSSAMDSCSNGFIALGIVYGLIILKNTKRIERYMLGIYNFESCLKIMLSIFLYLLIIVAPFSIFNFILKQLIKDAYFKYFISVGINFLIGFSLSYIIPTLAQKCDIIARLPQHMLNDI